MWCASSALCRTTLYGHTAEVVSAQFQPINSESVCTASMDGTARIFHIESTQELQNLRHHGAEVISSQFNRDANLLLTGSFDRTAAVCDLRANRYVHTYVILNFI